jgi:NADH-quinone oxidoreductase subunit M
MLDLSLREKVMLYPLIVLTIVFGFYPAPILDTTAAAVDNLVAHYATSIGLDPAVSLADAQAPLVHAEPVAAAESAATPAAH